MTRQSFTENRHTLTEFFFGLKKFRPNCFKGGESLIPILNSMIFLFNFDMSNI